jgi:trans-aconitate 2-methyltransferase
MTFEWDASTYDRVSDPQSRWGSGVLERLELAGDERVLDAGCGSGRVTELLAERLPRGRVVALDASQAMLDEARWRLSRFGARIEYVRADLAAPLPVDGPVDAVFSTAVLHWVADHDGVFRNFAAVLRPGGQLVVQCGGTGNCASVIAVLRETGDGWPGPWTFATPEETRRRLMAAGFEAVNAWLNPEPTAFETGAELETFLRTVVLGAHLERLPDGERAPFVHAVASRLPEAILDYVRLNVVARRSGAAGGR